MKFIKKHQIKIILITLLIIFTVFGYFVFTLIFPNDEGDLYGNRLIELENYAISSTILDELKNKLLETEQIEDVSFNISGRIVNFTLKMKEDVVISEAKLFSNEILVAFTKEQREYYDLQLFLTNETEIEGYPSIGYKHHTTEDFVWTNNNIQVVE